MAKKNKHNDFDDSQVKMPEFKELLSGKANVPDNNQKSNEKEKPFTITFVIRESVFFDFLRVVNDIIFSYQLGNKKQNSAYIITVALYNMETAYLKKYGTLEAPNETYQIFYTRRKAGTIAPSTMEIQEYNEPKKRLNIKASIQTKELLYTLMHCFYKNEIQQKYPQFGYSISEFFYEILDFLQKNSQKLKMI